jgi:predicted Ser/Thr protein kinase
MQPHKVVDCHLCRLAAIICAMERLPSAEQLRPWIENSLSRQENILAASNQGIILLFQEQGTKLAIKTPMGRGLLFAARRRTLLREYRAYQRLQGLAGVPMCYGLIDGRYLLLEFVSGRRYRDAVLPERERWFAELLQILRGMHLRGVCHADLKSKGNLLVTAEGAPCVVDFGTALVRKSGFHPLNQWLFRTGKRLDLNAWVKHKYHGYYRDASPEDRDLLDYGWLEVLARKLSGRPMDRVRRRKSRQTNQVH